MLDRAIRAAKVEPALYEEVERDENATTEAATVVAIAALASAIGAGISAASGGAGALIGTFLLTLILALVGWVVWSYVTFFVGTRFMGGTATPGELLRTIGYAQAPRVLNILGFIPVLNILIGIIVFFWSLWASFVATRQALDLDNSKTIITVIISAIIYLIIIFAVTAIFTPILLMGAR